MMNAIVNVLLDISKGKPLHPFVTIYVFLVFLVFHLCFIPYICNPKIRLMARICQVTGKVPIGGNHVSHSNIKTKRRFLPNLQTKRFFLAEENKWITLKLSTEGIRTINKNGLYKVVKELRVQGQHI